MKTTERLERRLWAGGDRLDGSGRRDGPPRPRRPLAVGALGAVALLVGLLVLHRLGGAEERKPGDGKRGTRTATVARRTLVERESVEGTLGYSGARAVVNRLATGDGSADGGSGGGEDSSGGYGRGGSSGGGGSETASASAVGSGAASSTGAASSASPGSSTGSPSGHSASLGGHRASGGRRSSPGARASVTSQAGPVTVGDENGTAGDRDRKGRGDGKGKGGKRGDRDDRRSGDRNRGRGRRGAGRDGSQGGRGLGGSGGSKESGRGPRTDGGSNGGGGGSAGGGASQGSGTVTGLAREGSIVDRGETLYELDNRPVLLMYGSVPAYRELSTATTDGPDVRQLEQNLVALGFGAGVTVDEDFSAATAAAVKRWQRSLGLPQTGEVELGRVVFLPGARRVGGHKTKVGGVLGSGTEVLQTTSIKRVVSVELDVAKQSLVRRGDKVTVTLPDGTTVSGRIARVGRVARKKDDGGGDGGVPGGGSGSEGGELVIDLSIVLGSRRGVSRLDQAPVTVGIAQERRRNALAVPVTALVARRGGGYGVEVVRGGRRRIVAVETGLFASGLVETSGRGIRAGTKVAIPEEA